MAHINILSLDASKIGNLEVSEDVFSCIENDSLLYEVIRWQLLSRRQGTSSAKTRSDVRGSSKKLYKQKGTGNARHGSIRAPIYVGGGQAHPPVPRAWYYKLSLKVRSNALRNALTKLHREKRIVVVDNLFLPVISTKKAIALLSVFCTDKNVLVVDTARNKNFQLSLRNCSRYTFLASEGVNAFDLLRHDVVLFSKDSIQIIEQKCLKN